jgi:hypothetical protein
MMLYVPHVGNLFMQQEHIDMTFSGVTIFNWFYGVALAAVIEFLILVFLINGYRTTREVLCRCKLLSQLLLLRLLVHIHSRSNN